ncbi:diaminobutyrate acetyltransferase [Paenibacillus solani]|uniref:L-2,4-diaminobutyric acid acetyltransferase n=1 Tax=Paenibacillus solani TaxID=1705565 RepID=A0A0M1P461_9BACL|nr:diaminobutyrate acetyltransferase [Paenibacillus solani]KOR89273.1 hypothetical protein AM231_09005 [Paenibacillus solani]
MNNFPQNEALQFRKPSAEDGSRVWRLIKETAVLDLNSSYCYIMLCDLFKETCAVAEQNGELVGFVSAFQPSERKNTLFIWQIAVAESERGQGVGLSLLKQLLEREENAGIRTIEATVSTSNIPSRSLFAHLAKDLGSSYEEGNGYSAHLFPGNAHEDENWIRIQIKG